MALNTQTAAASAPEQTKACSSQDCVRAGEQLPLSEFYYNRKTGCFFPYCKACTKIRMALSRKTPGFRWNKQKRRTFTNGKPLSCNAIRKLPKVTERVVEALRHRRMTFQELKWFIHVQADELSEALPTVMLWRSGRDRVYSKNGTGPRVFFLAPTPTQDSQNKRNEITPLSFSTLGGIMQPVTKGTSK